MTKVILRWHFNKILSPDKDEIELKIRLIDFAYFLQVKTHISGIIDLHYLQRLTLKSSFKRLEETNSVTNGANNTN